MKRLLPLLLAGCQTDDVYLTAIAERPDIVDVAECAFEPTAGGWEQYTCVPVFSARDLGAGAWESAGLGDFDILQRTVFGAPFYQLFYAGEDATGGGQIGYALSMDGTTWRRHPWNPLVRRGDQATSFDRDDVDVGCAAFDGDTGLYHLWYTGTNVSSQGTQLGHAVSQAGVLWSKDVLNPVDPLRATELPFARVWGCDALFEDGAFHFWVGGVHWDDGGLADGFPSARYDIGYLRTRDGSAFEDGPLVLEHRELLGDWFDAEGVHKPSVFVAGDAEGVPRYWMLYSGYREVSAELDPNTQLVYIGTDGRRLGVATADEPQGPFERQSDTPVPLDFSGEDTAESPRAFFINGRVHVFFRDRFWDPLREQFEDGIGLGIAPFPQETP